MDQIKISVVIPTYTRRKLLKKALQAIGRQSFPIGEYEVLVIDDGSKDNTQRLVKNLQKKHPYIKYFKQKHGGVFRARNLGIVKARGKIVAFTDDDCLVKNDWLEKIEKVFRQHPNAAGIEGKTVTYPEKVTPFTAQVVNTAGGGYQTCNIAYLKSRLVKAGGLDEKFGATHCDDVDLALRVQKYGPIIFSPKVVVVHPPRPTKFIKEIKRVMRIPAELYLFTKHPDYFTQKYGRKNLFCQTVFINSVWIRLWHLKYHCHWLTKNPLFYLKFLIRTVLEISLIVMLLPYFYYHYHRLKI